MNLEAGVLSPSVIEAIAEMGRYAAQRGWIPATSGNFSHRIDAAHIALTRSGVDKGRLSAADIVAVPEAGPIPPGLSAEAPLHLARYRSDPTIGAVMHVHTLAGTVLSRHAPEGVVEIRGFEMQKSLRGWNTHDAVLRIPVFENSQDTVALARLVESRLGDAAAPGYLLAGHGMYAWGRDAAEARRHTEGLEFLLMCALEERRLSA